MKIAFVALLFLYLHSLSAFGQSGDLVSSFRERLQSRYKGYNEEIKTQQVIIGSIELLGIAGLDRLIYRADAEAIETTLKEISLFQKIQTAEDYDKQIDDIKNNPRNYVEVVKDESNRFFVQDMTLKPSAIVKIEQIQAKIDRFKSSEDFVPRMKKYLIDDQQARIDAIIHDRSNYVEASRLRHAEVVGRELPPHLARQVDFLQAKQSVSMTNAQKEAKLNSLAQRLKGLTGKTAKGRALKGLNVIVRTGQIALAVDIGTRIYVINALESNPGINPTATFYCEAIECEDLINKAVGSSQRSASLSL